MAAGDTINTQPDAYTIELLATTNATNGQPTGTNGIDANAVRTLLGGLMPDKARVAVISTAGSGTMTVAGRLWGRLGTAGWCVAATLNGGSNIGETGSDTIGYTELVERIAAFDRFFFEITAIAGTGTSVKALLVLARPGG